jgi:anaerobic magnesium-protoporphyrin IX monomethyl ester cyclase
MYGGAVRYRPVDSVVEEISKYGLRNIALHSDTATLNKDWMYEFCAKIPREVRWICNSRVDTVDPGLLQTMQWAGCWMICYGIESGDDAVLKMNKKGATCEQAEKAVKWAKEAGLKIWAYGMLGLYGDDYKSMQRTIDFICSLKVDIANFAISCPYPGTQWFDICNEKGWLAGDSFDQNFSAIVEQPGCPASLVRVMQKRAYIKWYLSWKGIKIFLKNPWFFIRALTDHIRTFNSKTTNSTL